jgi:hypothetical protein
MRMDMFWSPLDTWRKYIDPQYRDRAVRMELDDND